MSNGILGRQISEDITSEYNFDFEEDPSQESPEESAEGQLEVIDLFFARRSEITKQIYLYLLATNYLYKSDLYREKHLKEIFIPPKISIS